MTTSINFFIVIWKVGQVLEHYIGNVSTIPYIFEENEGSFKRIQGVYWDALSFWSDIFKIVFVLFSCILSYKQRFNNKRNGEMNRRRRRNNSYRCVQLTGVMNFILVKKCFKSTWKVREFDFNKSKIVDL